MKERKYLVLVEVRVDDDMCKDIESWGEAVDDEMYELEDIGNVGEYDMGFDDNGLVEEIESSEAVDGSYGVEDYISATIQDRLEERGLVHRMCVFPEAGGLYDAVGYMVKEIKTRQAYEELEEEILSGNACVGGQCDD